MLINLFIYYPLDKNVSLGFCRNTFGTLSQKISAKLMPIPDKEKTDRNQVSFLLLAEKNAQKSSSCRPDCLNSEQTKLTQPPACLLCVVYLSEKG